MYLFCEMCFIFVCGLCYIHIQNKDFFYTNSFWEIILSFISVLTSFVSASMSCWVVRFFRYYVVKCYCTNTILIFHNVLNRFTDCIDCLKLEHLEPHILFTEVKLMDCWSIWSLDLHRPVFKDWSLSRQVWWKTRHASLQ